VGESVNIFYLSHDTEKCAEAHVDKHCVKMVLEYAQLLSTTHRFLDGTVSVNLTDSGRKKTVYSLHDKRDALLYSVTHINHPSAVWVRQSRDNYVWLWKLLDSLCKEYTYRYGKVHKVERDGLLEALRFVPSGISEHPKFTEPTPAMPDDVKVPNDSISSYRNYYIKNKTHLASWKGKVNSREIPLWYSEGVNIIRNENANVSVL
jgi:hypothetical protein